MIITRSPLRIPLSGGGTDLSSYYQAHGGMLIAAAIDKYAYITDFENLTAKRVEVLVRAGRDRHIIEDDFNTDKNHGIGLGHVFCANQNGSKKYFP